MAAACSLPYLEAHTEPHDLTGGFLGRWAIMLAHRERTNPDPVGDLNGLAELIEAIRYRAAVDDAGPCMGLTETARQRWTDWFYELDKRELPKLIAGTRTRAPAIARKVAMLLAWDWGEALQGEPWRLHEQHIEYGIRFVELHIASVTALGERLAEHPDALLRRQVLGKIEGTMSLGQIMRATKLRKRTLMEILSGLTIEGTLEMTQYAGSGGEADQIYTRVDQPL